MLLILILLVIYLFIYLTSYTDRNDNSTKATKSLTGTNQKEEQRKKTLKRKTYLVVY